MFPRSLQWRLVCFFCLIIFCLIIPIGLFLNSRIESKYYDNFEKQIDNGFHNWTIKEDSPSAQRLVDELKNKNTFRMDLENRSYTITDKNGHIVDTNDYYDLLAYPSTALNSLLSSDNYIAAMSDKDGGKQILENYNGNSFFDYAVQKGDYILYFRYYKDDWSEITRDFNDIIYLSLAIGLAIAFITGYFLSRTITSPIGKLMHKANSIAAGDFDQVLVANSGDEIGLLTVAFNSMAANLKKNLIEISSEKSKMETILNYMTDGVIAFNLRGKVIHTNPAASRLLGIEGSVGTFREYCSRFGFKYRIEDVIYLESQKSSEMNISIGEKTIKVYFAVFTDENKKPEGVIAVLQDITEQQRLENMRKEFVANVSHELRTPLTSIKSYSETLLDGALEDRETSEHFLGVINNEADRMTRLVKDLLQLSRLDNQQMKWQFERISLVDLVKSAVERLGMEANSRKQTLECYVLGEIPEIDADYGRMEQVVFNIIGNSLKYTPENGKVTVYIGKLLNDVYFKVADNGIGIPESDLPRIFERFYRVDKARSREMGGTGLGLAIAKEIVEAHSGSITITSSVNVGTEVTVQLPIKQTGQLNEAS